MYRYYKTSIQTLDDTVLPDPEPNNWLGYRYEDKYFLKTREMISAEELDGEDIRTCPINSELLKDQFP